MRVYILLSSILDEFYERIPDNLNLQSLTYSGNLADLNSRLSAESVARNRRVSLPLNCPDTFSEAEVAYYKAHPATHRPPHCLGYRLEFGLSRKMFGV
jgi:hypothetical protein